jgi:hypothetical protein
MKKKKLQPRLGLLLASLLLVNAGLVKAQTQFIREYTLNYRSGGLNMNQQTIDKDASGYIFGGAIYQGTVADPYGVTHDIFDPLINKVNEDGSLSGFTKKYSITAPSGGYASFGAVGVKRIYSKMGLSCDGYLLSGEMDLSGSFNTEKHGGLIKTDLAGNVVWAKRLTYTGYYGHKVPFTIQHVEQVSNGKLIVVGYFHYGDKSKFEQEGVVMRINPVNGTIEWRKEFNSPEYLQNDMIPAGLIEANPGEYFIYGYGNVGRTAFVLKITDGALTPSSFLLKSIQALGSTIPTGIEYVDGDLILVGNLDGTMWDNSPVFALRVDENLSEVKDLAGVLNKSNVYFGQHSDPDMVLASDVLINNDRIVLSTLRNTSTDPNFIFGIPMNMTLSPSGNIIDIKEGNVDVFYKSAVTMFNAMDSYVTGDKRVFSPYHYRLTSRSTDGKTCDDVNMTTGKYQVNASIRDASVNFIQPSFEYENISVTVSDPSITAYSICEDCDVSSAGLAIATSTGESSFCEGGSINLFAPTGFVSYNWFHDGEAFGSGSSVSITEGGNYSVMCYDVNGCEVEVSIYILEYERCKVNFTFPHKSYCSLDLPSSSWVGWFSDPLENCNGAYSYAWTFDGDPVSGHMTIGDHATEFIGPGMYEVTITTPCGVETFSQLVVDDLVIEVNHSYALPGFDNYIAGNAAFKMINFSTAFDEYQWDVVNLTTAATWSTTTPGPTYMYVPYTPGSGEVLEVTLTLTDVAACKIYKNTITWSDGPGLIQKSTLLSQQGKKHQTSMYPNPVNESLHIRLASHDEEKVQIEIKDLGGKVVYRYTGNQDQYLIETSDFSEGIYIVTVQSRAGIFNEKFVVQH